MIGRRFFLAASASCVALPTRAIADALPSLPEVTLINSHHEQAAQFSTAFGHAHVKIPRVRALCHTAQGVQRVVRWARDTEQSFAIRSSGHSFANLSSHPDLVIDLRQMNQTQIDRNAGTVTVGAGVLSHQVSRHLADQELSIPGGICPTVAMAGYALGGGIGYFARRDGLLSDQLKSLRMVTADGALIDVSEQANSDLFWACRGGGNGNFGVVTDLTFAIQPFQQIHWVHLSLRLDAVRAAEALYLWQRRSRDWPRHTTLHFRLHRSKGTEFQATLEGLSGLPVTQLAAEVASVMRTSPDAVKGAIHVAVASQLHDRIFPRETGTNIEINRQSHLFDTPLDPASTLEVLSSVLELQQTVMHLSFESLGGAVADLAPDATAFPHRNAQFVLQANSFVPSPALRHERRSAARKLRDVLTPMATGGVYVNYTDLELSDWGYRYWGANLPRLKAIKRTYDPDSVFDHAHSLNRA